MTMPRKPSSRPSSELPQSMNAAAMNRTGAPSVLELQTLPVPPISANEVLIRLHASGVGIWDADIRKGWWPSGRPHFPLILGSDGAGVIVAKGSGARGFRIGDAVWAHDFLNPKGGFYAEYAAVPASNVGRIPDGLDLLHAGAATATALTAQQGVDDVLKVRRGETVLVFGATGAVGSLAIQFAKARGARVIATASGLKARRFVLALGAEAAIDARSADAIDRLRSVAPQGLDAVIAFAGGAVLDKFLNVVKRGGRVAFPYGVEPEPMQRRRRLRISRYDAEASPQQFAKLARAVEKARLRVPIAATFPLAQAARAHERLAHGGVLGRIVLQVRRARG
jgi:NADPH:quinone reductase